MSLPAVLFTLAGVMITGAAFTAWYFGHADEQARRRAGHVATVRGQALTTDQAPVAAPRRGGAHRAAPAPSLLNRFRRRPAAAPRVDDPIDALMDAIRDGAGPRSAVDLTPAVDTPSPRVPRRNADSETGVFAAIVAGLDGVA